MVMPFASCTLPYEQWVEAVFQASYDIYGMRRGEFNHSYTADDLRAWYDDPARGYTLPAMVAVVAFRKTFTGVRSPLPRQDAEPVEL